MRKNAILFLILSIGLVQAVLAQEPASNQNFVKPYLLTPGDQIVAKVMGEPDFGFEAIVDENGNIDIPYFDTPVKAMCKTERELKLEVLKMLGKYLRSPQLTLFAKDRNQNRPTVAIWGEVRTQQQVVLMRQFRLAELLARSGGPNENAGAIVSVTHTQLPMCASAEEIAEWNAVSTGKDGKVTRIYKLNDVNSGVEELNPIIYPGDIIEVPTAKPVYIAGEVKTATGIYIKGDGLTLFEAISKIGGLDRTANKEVKIYRLKKDIKDVNSFSEKDREVLTANIDTIQKTQKGDIMLQPYDIILVDKAKKSIGATLLELAIGGARTAFQGVSGGIGTKILY